MTFGLAEVFLGIAVAIYIYMIINRICQCFESCATQKAMSNVYHKINPDILRDLIEKVKTKET